MNFNICVVLGAGIAAIIMFLVIWASAVARENDEYLNATLSQLKLMNRVDAYDADFILDCKEAGYSTEMAARLCKEKWFNELGVC